MLIINPNFTTDRTIPVDRLSPGTVMRTRQPAITLGGKGVNVARVARAFGHRAALVGFMPGASAEVLAELATGEGAELAGVPIAGSVRAASIILEQSGRVTVLNEPGPVVNAGDWRRLLDQVTELAAGQATVICSGSLPPGSPADAYARVVDAGRSAGLRTIVDAAGPVLDAALTAEPDVVSPNLAEAEALLSGAAIEEVDPTGDDVLHRALAAARGLVARGARGAVVSAGSHGAAACAGGDCGVHHAPTVTVVNPIGAGDSLVGGLAHALEEGLAWDDAVRFALAVASASCEQDLAGGVDVTRVGELLAAGPDRHREPGPVGK
jgi:1-phosphofructokinase family hexose kinase